MADQPLIFLSHAGANSFEASLMQFSFEHLLADFNVKLWSYVRDQEGDERAIGKSIKDRIVESWAIIFLVSPYTLSTSPTQWMELAYADAFEIPTFVLLHHMTFDDLRKSEHSVPPLLLARQCTSAVSWRTIVEDLKQVCCSRSQKNTASKEPRL
jgi:hypothetical protein